MTRLQPLIIIIAALTGLLLGYFSGAGPYSAILIEPFLMLLLFFVFLSVDLRGLAKAFRNIRFALLSLLINFVWTPLFAFALCLLLLGGNTDLQTGFLMLMVTPCTDWYLVFTGLAHGNVELGAAILPANLILQVLLLPAYLFLFMGGELAINGVTLLLSILAVLVIPFTLARLLKFLFTTFNRRGILDFLTLHTELFQLIFLCGTIIAMFASESRTMMSDPAIFLKMLLPVLVFFAVNFILAQIAGKAFRFPYPDKAALTLTTLARNSPLSLAIAVAAFSDRPHIALALVIGPLIELPVLGLAAWLLRRIHAKEPRAGDSKEA